jgi:glycerol-1-phosphate dehydrogenase [NAD(P)+]
VEFGIPCELHGIQCAVGTLIAVKLYEKLVALTPDRERARSFVADFDYDAWCRELRDFMGKGAQAMIDLAKKEGKYDKAKHAIRLETILGNWEDILAIIHQELPKAAQLEGLMDDLQIPKTLSQIGARDEQLPLIFHATKDIRNKYVLSHLAWDLGVINEILEK